MPHSTRSSSANRPPSFKFPADPISNVRTSMEPFPDHREPLDGQSYFTSSPAKSNGYLSGIGVDDRWAPRKESLRELPYTNGSASTGGRHGSQKSLNDAFRTIRTRRTSVSVNVHEVADALKAPVSPKLIVRLLFFADGASTD